MQDVIDILNNSGLGLPGYYGWRKRSGCYFCFYQTDNEWKGLRKYHPVEFEKACIYEENHSDGRIYTWRGKNTSGYLFLRDLSEALIENEVVIESGKDNKLSTILGELDYSFQNSILSGG